PAAPPAGQVSAELPHDLVAALRELGRTESASLFMVLHAALATLLSRLGAGDDIPIGTPASGRADPVLDDLVGFFVNTVVLRTDLSGAPTFTELLRRVRESDLAAFEHANLPFQQVVEAVNPARAQGRNPLFQVMLGYLRRPAGRGTVLGLPVGEAPAVAADPKVDLNVTFVDGEPFEVILEYDAGRFRPATARRLVDRLLVLLGEVADRPDRPVGEARVLAGHDRADLARWQDGGPPRTGGQPWYERFSAQARLTPDADACVFAGETMSYAELDAASDAFAARLGGLGPEDLVGIALPRSAALLVAVLGVAKAGAAYLPLDPAFPAERLRFMVADARPVAIVVDERTRELFPEGITPSGVPASFVPPPRDPRSAAYVIYTSGSTGRPKGVVVTQRDLECFLAALPVAGPGERLLAVTTLSFDISVLELMGPLTAGGCVVLASDAEVRDPHMLAGLLRRERVSVMQATPSLWSTLPPEAELRGVRVLAGGEALPPSLARDLSARAVSVTNLYGPTEVTVWATAAAVRGDEPPTLGRPLPGTTAYVLDTALRPAPPGVAGELYLGGAQVTRGYLRRPGLTASRFVADPFTGGRMYRTGDLARWNGGGELEFLGRADHQVKVRGHRVEPGEIEAVAATCPGVSQVAVVARQDRLVAYVTAPAPALRDHLAGRLPSWMVPSAVVVLDELPLTPNGKVDRAALPEADLAQTAGGAEPRTRTEAAVCAVLGEVLGTGPVGVDDDFFALGGHSLLLVRLAAALRARLGADLPVGDLFAAPTAAALARRISGGVPVADAMAELLSLRPGDGTRTPLFCFPPAGGLSWPFAPLKRYLPDGVPLYGLQSPRLSRDSGLPATMDDLAAEYAGLIAGVAPEGPLALLGWSFGGAVAHKVAVRLAAQGRDIRLLGMLDTPVEVSGGAADVAALLAEMGYRVPDARMSAADAVAFLRSMGDGVAALEDEQIERVVESYLAGDRMMARARYDVYPGDVLFVDATVPEQGFTGAASKRWRPYVAGELRVAEIGCRHSELLDAGTLEILGPLLARLM
ncbi:amino acid adenylation domain-containing protein, partial [Nonomuraea sp. KC401]|uniref:non-ribosomal peptide synthetase n=1 Tax=unclassified Nonomuraea TaxID=2593643 RepID=UPI0010FEFCE3